MTQGGGDLNEWVDTAAVELGARLHDPVAWSRTSYELDLPLVDFAALLKNTQSKTKRMLLVAAHKMALRVYMQRIGGGPEIYACEDESPPMQLVLHMASRAGMEVYQLLFDRFGDELPPGHDKMLQRGRELRVAHSLQQNPKATMVEHAKLAGVSRATLYRILDRKDSG